QSILVDNMILLPNAQNPALSDLYWIGTSGADQVAFEQVDATTIRARETMVNGSVADNARVFSGVTGRVIATALDGSDILDASGLIVTQAALDGGGGSNTLYGGQAGDILIGGANGAEGTQSNNTIIAGNGNNTIYGNAIDGLAGTAAGNNLIVGGSGID